MPSSHDSQSQDVATEIDVMLTIGRALMELSDPEARMRVLRWAMGRFHVDLTTSAAAPSAAASSPQRVQAAADPDLAVDGIRELFDNPGGAAHAEAATAAPTKPQPPAAGGVDAMIRSLADDFRRLAVEWQGT